ncbi:MAG TPA: hypothetical protein VK936_12335 [Longimicrobiales bacterium]|nr:hypothetical protein [Longimicrobiales bacterium]
MISTLLTFLIVGFVALVVIGIVLSLVGAMVGLAFTLLFKVAPILLVGYLIVRFLVPRPKQLASEDKEWLDS